MQHNADRPITFTSFPCWPDVREEVPIEGKALVREQLCVRLGILRLDVAAADVPLSLVHLEVNEGSSRHSSQHQAVYDVFRYELCRNVPDPKQRTVVIAVKASGHPVHNDERQKSLKKLTTILRDAYAHLHNNYTQCMATHENPHHNYTQCMGIHTHLNNNYT